LHLVYKTVLFTQIVFFILLVAMQKNDRKQFIDVFVAKNQQLNLSAIRDADGVFVKHVSDAIELNTIWKFEDGQEVIDVGTGG